MLLTIFGAYPMRLSLGQIGNHMQIPQWTKPGLYGAGVGALALAIIGFAWGGWVTGGDAVERADDQSAIAVAEALTPYCVAQSSSAAGYVAVMAELESASSFQRRSIVENAGWATPLGSDTPNRMLATNCEKAIAAL